ncbi:MAG: 4Fe-4S binding protein [Cyanobacteria bacterium P01_E01_bin.6]
MPYVITNQCIGCDRCLSVCPTQAVQRDEHHYWIDASQCNACEGVYRVAQCWAGCPTNNACISFTDSVESVDSHALSRTFDYWDSWFDTYNRLVVRLKTTQSSAYWRHWFEQYSTFLSRLKDKTPSYTCN